MRHIRFITHPNPPEGTPQDFSFTITVKEASNLARILISEWTSSHPSVIMPELKLTRYQAWYIIFGSMDQRDINELIDPRHLKLICQEFLERRLELSGKWKQMEIITESKPEAI